MYTPEPPNGFAIGKRLRQVSGDVLQVSDRSLYPALHKLEHQGSITAEWKQTENNRRAKFYALTRSGRRQLEKESANWERLANAISALVRVRCAHSRYSSPVCRPADDAAFGVDLAFRVERSRG
jgi:transcriptional regulator